MSEDRLYDLSQYSNLLDLVPNVAELPRNVIVSFTGQDTDYKYSTVYNVGRDAFIGLDVTLYNNSGSQATAFLDSRDYWILDANVRTLTNIPFNELLIGTTGATANAIDGTIFGCSLKYIQDLARKRIQSDQTVGKIQLGGYP
tara:strand:+ start:49 stop:477 length:429 start_codon:yes stop_codon:yes gene_type:complete